MDQACGGGLGSFQHITFTVHFISNLTPLLISKEVPICGSEVGNPLSREKCSQVAGCAKSSQGFRIRVLLLNVALSK